jgi:UDP-N-acetylglucosamine 2-epimerase (non-hydrolysing)
MIKILFILGTRPEAIKLKPLIKELRSCDFFDTRVCLTNQHPEMSGLIGGDDFISLPLEREGSSLTELNGLLLTLLFKNKEIPAFNPDLIVVHGDTTSSLCGAMYAFYSGIKVCHVEAGLRTHEVNPFPEEFNRRTIDGISDMLFAPTEKNRDNLAKEGISKGVYVVGNTSIDVLKTSLNSSFENQVTKWTAGDDFIISTMHRRENWGCNFSDALDQIDKFAAKSQRKFVYVCNNNADLAKTASAALGANPNVYVSRPLPPEEFQNLLWRCKAVLTDSGGIQEEAVFLKKPLLILRESTERKEITELNAGKLINPAEICSVLHNLDNLDFNFNNYDMYGMGETSSKIKQQIMETYAKRIS